MLKRLRAARNATESRRGPVEHISSSSLALRRANSAARRTYLDLSLSPYSRAPLAGVVQPGLAQVPTDSGRTVDSPMPPVQASLAAVCYRTSGLRSIHNHVSDRCHCYSLVTPHHETLINVATNGRSEEHPHHEPVTERPCGHPSRLFLVCSATTTAASRCGDPRRISVEKWLATTRHPDRNLCKHHPKYFSSTNAPSRAKKKVAPSNVTWLVARYEGGRTGS